MEAFSSGEQAGAGQDSQLQKRRTSRRALKFVFYRVYWVSVLLGSPPLLSGSLVPILRALSMRS